MHLCNCGYCESIITSTTKTQKKSQDATLYKNVAKGLPYHLHKIGCFIVDIICLSVEYMYVYRDEESRYTVL